VQPEQDVEIEDPRTQRERETDMIYDQLRDVGALARAVLEVVEKQQNGPVQKVIYRHEGMGAVGIVCAATCILCIIGVIVLGIFINGQMTRTNMDMQEAITRSEARVDGRLRDLEAWRGVHATKIQNLENLQKGTGK
jgi:hypothetical protein